MNRLQDFKDFLRDHRDLQLIHDRKRYKAGQVLEVLCYTKTYNTCGFHDRYDYKFLIKCENDIYFYVLYYSGCDCNNFNYTMESFFYDKLVSVLSKLDPDLCDQLFPIEDDDSNSY